MTDVDATPGRARLPGRDALSATVRLSLSTGHGCCLDGTCTWQGAANSVGVRRSQGLSRGGPAEVGPVWLADP
jgi:hypothetical protein